MPIITRVDHERREVLSLAVGPITYADVVEHLSIQRHARGLAYPEMIDFRGAGIAFTHDEVLQMGDVIRQMARETTLGRTAFLVSSDAGYDAVLALTTMVEGSPQLMPFRDEAEALAWMRAGSKPARPAS